MVPETTPVSVKSPPTQIGWIEYIKEKFALSAMWQKVKDSQNTLLQGVLYGCAGFLFGFLCKRMSSFFITLIIFGLFLFLLHHMGIITVMLNWHEIYMKFGIQLSAEESLYQALLHWIKTNLIAFVSLVIGFLLGLKVG